METNPRLKYVAMLAFALLSPRASDAIVPRRK